MRPCCSQCANVGFECKTSDKLSRRAFPRGYTESLEERVRCLEREVRELKELLDAKDEQLEMVSKIHSFSPYSPPSSDASRGTQRTGKRSESVRSNSEEADEVINIEHSGRLVKMEGQREGLYMGASSGRGFVGRFPTMAVPWAEPFTDNMSRNCKAAHGAITALCHRLRDGTVFPRHARNGSRKLQPNRSHQSPTTVVE